MIGVGLTEPTCLRERNRQISLSGWYDIFNQKSLASAFLKFI